MRYRSGLVPKLGFLEVNFQQKCLCRFKLTRSNLYPFFLDWISDVIGNHRKKNQEECEGKIQPCFTPFSTPNGSEISPLKLTETFIPVCKADTSLTKCSRNSNIRRMFHNVLLFIVSVGYHLPFQHNELGHLPYMAVALIPRGSSPDQSEISLRVWDQKSHSYCWSIS